MPDSQDQLSFEQAYSDLETLVAKLESGDLSLADALGTYERGVKALGHCHSLLGQAERKLEELVRSPEGTVSTRPAALDTLRGEASGQVRVGQETPIRAKGPAKQVAQPPLELVNDSIPRPAPRKHTKAQPAPPPANTGPSLFADFGDVDLST